VLTVQPCHRRQPPTHPSRKTRNRVNPYDQLGLLTQLGLMND
jgi:hypothetical protein